MSEEIKPYIIEDDKYIKVRGFGVVIEERDPVLGESWFIIEKDQRDRKTT